MSTYAEILIQRYRNKGALIDANLLLLLYAGNCDVRLIGPRFMHLKAYTVEDYYALSYILKQFSRLVTTPNVLTEVSNLANKFTPDDKQGFFPQFAKELVSVEEFHFPSNKAAKSKLFPILGLTDSVLLNLCQDYLIITDDLRFYAKLTEQGLEALNFNHVRMEYLFAQ
jgi:hypothetical protein